ncbi:MAG: 4Fe-4S binding protein [Candidatus Helarchaeota archaeon]
MTQADPTETEKTEKYYKKIRDALFMPRALKESIQLLKAWYSPEEARVVSVFKTPMMVSMPIEKIAAKTKMPEEKVKEIVERLVKKGLLYNFVNKKDENKLYYALAFLFPGLFEWYFASPFVSIDEKRNAAKLFEKLEPVMGAMMASKYETARVAPAMDARIKTIKVEEPVEVGQSQVLLFEDVVKILENSWSIAVMPCPCRVFHGTILRDGCDKPIDVCINLNSVSEYVHRVGIGRKISIEEAKAILHMAEKAGLVHLVNNLSTKHSFICNCCSDCCGFLSVVNKFKLYDGVVARSDYRPRVDLETCIKCAKCVKICPVGALHIVYGNKEDLSDTKIIVRDELCLGCGVCAVNCPKQAINLEKIKQTRAEDLEDQLWKGGMRTQKERLF